MTSSDEATIVGKPMGVVDFLATFERMHRGLMRGIPIEKILAREAARNLRRPTAGGVIARFRPARAR